MRSQCFLKHFPAYHLKESSRDLSVLSSHEGLHQWQRGEEQQGYLYSVQEFCEEHEDFIGGEAGVWEMLTMMRIQASFSYMRYKSG